MNMKNAKINKNVLILLGSPREDGNSSRLALAFADEASLRGYRVQAVRLSELHISLTTGEVDKRNGVQPNDDMSSIAPLVRQAGILVFCTPLYFFTWSAPLKLLWDRLAYYSPERNPKLVGKTSVLLAAAADNAPAAYKGLRATYNACVDYMQWTSLGEVLALDVAGIGDINKTEKWLKQAQALARKLPQV